MADNPFQFGSENAASNASPDGAVPAPFAQDESSGTGWELHDLLGGNWPLAALFVAGALCLWGMKIMRGPASASAQQIEVQSSVDDALAKLAGPLAASSDKTTASIVETFYCEARQRQIPPASLRANPFSFKAQAPPAAASAPATEPRAATAPVDTAEADAMAAAKSLRLQSVLMGARSNAALIGDNLLSEGQVIQGWTVSKILPREVHLAWKDKTYVLKMPE